MYKANRGVQDYLECPASALTGARPNCRTLWNNAGLRDASAVGN